LMVEDPLDKVEAFVAAGADMITFHLEAARQPHRVLQRLAGATNLNDPERGVVRGVAINPSTPIAALEPLVDDLEFVLVLAINPGWGGQGFLPGTARRLAQARRLIEAAGHPIVLGVDGGVTRDNAAHVASLGADVIVSGSAIFDGTDAAANATLMLDLVRGTARSAAGVAAAPS
ncbi:MAG TPA: ribulose-phosphate 3-epimerase, partial [Candidatus Limnocylindrales bacterium]